MKRGHKKAPGVLKIQFSQEAVEYPLLLFRAPLSMWVPD